MLPETLFRNRRCSSLSHLLITYEGSEVLSHVLEGVLQSSETVHPYSAFPLVNYIHFARWEEGVIVALRVNTTTKTNQDGWWCGKMRRAQEKLAVHRKMDFHLDIGESVHLALVMS